MKINYTKHLKIAIVLLLAFAANFAKAQCVASFTYSVGANGLVTFSSTSGGVSPSTSYTWAFGSQAAPTATGGINMTNVNTTYAANGTYTVLLNNDKIDVIDYTKYDFGVFKTHYHSVAKIQVGDSVKETIASNENGITIKNIPGSENEIKLQVLYKNKPLPNNELKIFVADLWSKTLETDENGMVTFKLPWKTKYIVETTVKEEVPGKYNGKDYEFTWHCVTYTIL